MPRTSVRIRFRKSRDLRFTSHRDLMRTFERLFRRAQFPFALTGGFNPKPRMVFAAPLPLGVVGHDEVVDIELTEPINPADVYEKLAGASPPGLEILAVEGIAARPGPRVRSVSYRLTLSDSALAGLVPRAAQFLASEHIWIERTRPRRRPVDLRPYVINIVIRQSFIELELSMSAEGTARPDEVLEALGLAGTAQNGAIWERTKVNLVEEPTAATEPAHSGPTYAACP